jgi:hypothetical protein
VKVRYFGFFAATLRSRLAALQQKLIAKHTTTSCLVLHACILFHPGLFNTIMKLFMYNILVYWWKVSTYRLSGTKGWL